jgi:outer membrane protein TolC
MRPVTPSVPLKHDWCVRWAKLTLARSLEVLKDQEEKTQRYLALQYRRIASAYEQIRAQRTQRETFEAQMEARLRDYREGRCGLDALLEAERFWRDARANEKAALVTYTNAQVGFDFARGATLERHKVSASQPAKAEAELLP